MNKFLACIVIICVFITMAVVSPAEISDKDAFYEKVAEKQFSKEFEESAILWWPLADRLELIGFMNEEGYPLSAELLDAISLPNSLNRAEISDIVDKLIVDCFGNGRDGILVLADVIAKDEGPIEFWSYQRKAWYDAAREKYDPNFTIEVYGGCLLPGEADLSYEEAYAISKAALVEAYGLTESDFANLKRQGAGFSEMGTFQGTIPGTIWHFVFYPDSFPEGAYDSPYEVIMSNIGEIEVVCAPYYLSEDTQ